MTNMSFHFNLQSGNVELLNKIILRFLKATGQNIIHLFYFVTKRFVLEPVLTATPVLTAG